MVKFCGKCGTRLDVKTGLCTKCNADEIISIHLKKQRRKRILTVCIITAFVFVISTAVAIFGLFCLKKRNLLSEAPSTISTDNVQEVTTQPETTMETLSPVEEFLENWILPQHELLEDRKEITIPYKVLKYDTFIEMEPGPIALLATEVADVDGNGYEDVTAISLWATEPHIPNGEVQIEDGLCELETRIEVDFFDENGHTYAAFGFIENTCAKESVTFVRDGSNLIRIVGSDGANDYSKDSWMPISNVLSGHLDELTLFDLNNEEKSKFDYSASRYIHFDDKKWSTDGVQYNTNREVGTLFDSHSTLSGMYYSELAACQQIVSTLRDVYGVADWDIQPFNWETRWENDFLPDAALNQQLCTFSIRCTPSEQASSGIMTITVENEK